MIREGLLVKTYSWHKRRFNRNFPTSASSRWRISRRSWSLHAPLSPHHLLPSLTPMPSNIISSSSRPSISIPKCSSLHSTSSISKSLNPLLEVGRSPIPQWIIPYYLWVPPEASMENNNSYLSNRSSHLSLSTSIRWGSTRLNKIATFFPQPWKSTKTRQESTRTRSRPLSSSWPRSAS